MGSGLIKKGQTLRKNNVLLGFYGDSHPQSADDGFNPNADSWVYSIAIQTDGKILVGGWFTSIGGQWRYRIARLRNTDAALQELRVSSNGSRVTWMRSQTSPEVWRVTFEHSPDGATWNLLGKGTRITGGWQITGLTMPLNQIGYVRARGIAAGGYSNASSSLIESERQYYNFPPKVSYC